MSILITSINNVLAFLTGIILPIPALRSFCTQVRHPEMANVSECRQTDHPHYPEILSQADCPLWSITDVIRVRIGPVWSLPLWSVSDLVLSDVVSVWSQSDAVKCACGPCPMWSGVICVRGPVWSVSNVIHSGLYLVWLGVASEVIPVHCVQCVYQLPFVVRIRRGPCPMRSRWSVSVEVQCVPRPMCQMRSVSRVVRVRCGSVRSVSMVLGGSYLPAVTTGGP